MYVEVIPGGTWTEFLMKTPEAENFMDLDFDREQNMPYIVSV